MKAKEIYPEKQLMHFVNSEIYRLNESITRYISEHTYRQIYDVFNSEIHIHLFDHYGDIRAIGTAKEIHIHCAFDEQIEPFAIAHVTNTPSGYIFERITYNQFYE